ncbi:MAG: stage II sporulation protein M [Jatrophihabitantaceae bacterium]
MDVDAFIAQHSPEWARLDVLARRRRLTADEADELVVLYRRVATHLALVQSRTPDPVLATRLSGLLARGRAATIAGSRTSGWSALARGVTVSFPVAVYRTWRWWVAMIVANLGVAAAMMLWLQAHPERLNRLLSSDDVRQLVDREFSDYYSAHPARAFAAQVWTNNALVAATAMFLGVTLVGTLYVMWQNTVNLGVVGGAMLGAGKANVFFGLILPHGMLELTAVFIAGGVGLRTGWAWVAPGPLPRSRALAEAGRTAGVVALGLAGVLLVSGVIEAFVTPSGLPTAVRIGIGALAEVAFLSYVVVLGRRAVRAGATGDLTAQEREDVLPVA